MDVHSAWVSLRLSLRMDAAEKSFREGAPDSQFAILPATAHTLYIQWLFVALFHLINLEAMLGRSGLSIVGSLSEWGQSASLVACAVGLVHWTYVCHIAIRDTLRRDMSEVTSLAGNDKSSPTLSMRWRNNTHWRRAEALELNRIRLHPGVLDPPARKTAEQLGQDLMDAIRLGDIRGTQLALDLGAPVNHRNGELETPLSLAVVMGEARIVELLLHQGAIMSAIPAAVLHLAIKMKNLPMVELLTSNGTTNLLLVDQHGESLAQLAARKENVPILDYLLRSLRSSGLNCFFKIVPDDIVRMDDAGQSDQTLPSTHTLGFRQLPNAQVADVLFQHLWQYSGSIEVDVPGPANWRTCFLRTLEYAVAADAVTVVRSMLQRKVTQSMRQHKDTQNGGRPGLFHSRIYHCINYAAIQANILMLKTLLEHVGCGAALSLRNRHYSTALHEAARRSRVEATQLLLEYGAKPNVFDGSTTTPLQQALHPGPYAIRNHRIHSGMHAQGPSYDDESHDVPRDTDAKRQILQILLNFGADPNLWRGEGADFDRRDLEMHPTALWDPPLVLAAHTKDPFYVKTLLRAGAEPDLGGRAKRPLTALHVASALGFLDIVVELLRAGASQSMVDDDGFTPLRLAEENGCEEVAGVLRTFNTRP